MSVQSFVEQSVTRQAARLKAMKKILSALDSLADEDARAVIADLADSRSIVDAEPGK